MFPSGIVDAKRRIEEDERGCRGEEILAVHPAESATMFCGRSAQMHLMLLMDAWNDALSNVSTFFEYCVKSMYLFWLFCNCNSLSFLVAKWKRSGPHRQVHAWKYSVMEVDNQAGDLDVVFGEVHAEKLRQRVFPLEQALHQVGNHRKNVGRGLFRI